MHFAPDGDTDTICAVSTAMGYGGIGVLRLSGAQSLSIIRKVFPKFEKEKAESHRAVFGALISSKDKTTLDEVIVTPFLGGKSYTGEESVEISCHGSPVVQRRIQDELISLGARLALPGEFTYRAFVNGKIDLIQAEAVLSLIESESARSADVSLKQLRGGLSKELSLLKDDLIWVLANLEASIDFEHEDIDVLQYEGISLRLKRVQEKLSHFVDSFHEGKMLSSGLQVVILGLPNVGKSSLLNALLDEDRAIVTDIPGTTRDAVIGNLILNGVRIEFVDTAGIRESVDEVEQIGVEKSISVAEGADLVLYVLDSTKERSDEEDQLMERFSGKVKILLNKSDLLSSKHSTFGIHVSAKTGEGIESIKALLREEIERRTSGNSDVVIQSRQAELFEIAKLKVEKTKSLVGEKQSPDLIALELREGLDALLESSGERFDDQVMDRVFSEFCIGK